MERRTFLKVAGASGLAVAVTGGSPLRPGDTTGQAGATQPGASSGTPDGNGTVTDSPTGTDGEEATPGNSEDDGIEFDRTVNGVEDLGMDPTGEQPIDDQLDEALVDGTLLELPPGQYLTARRHTVDHLVRWGLRGTGESRDETAVLPPEGAGLFFLNVRSGRDILLENLNFDVRAGQSEWLNNTFKVSDGLRIRQVGYVGFYASEVTAEKVNQGANVSGPLHVHITSPDGVGRIEGLVRRGPTHHAPYPRGNSCIFVGPQETVGTLVIADSHIENMSSHGIYASRTRGQIHIENTLFKNNNGANCRISGPDSSIRNSEIVMDSEEIFPGTTGDVFTSLTAGVWFESGFRTQAGGEMMDCSVRLGAVPDRVRGIEIDGSAGRTVVTDTEITVEGGAVRPVDINRPGKKGSRVRTRGSVPPTPRVELSGVTVTGRAPGPGGAIDVVGRPNSRVENCTVDIADRGVALAFTDTDEFELEGSTVTVEGAGDGIHAMNSPRGRIRDTTVRVPNTPLVVDTLGPTESCPLRVDGLTARSTRYRGLGASPENYTVDSEGYCLDPSTLEGGGRVQLVHADPDGSGLRLFMNDGAETPGT